GLVDGAVIASILINDPIIQSLNASKMPFVLIGRHPTMDVNYLDVDNQQAGRKATMHLVRLGYKRIGTITGSQNHVAGYDRYLGYLKAIEDSGHPVRNELVAEGDFSEQGGYDAMLRLLKYKPDAVFVASDMMAFGAMRALREAKLRIPEDVAIVGFDDIPTAAKAEPPLTTVRQNISQMGGKAVDLLIEIIESGMRPTHKVFMDTELVVRESCGASISK
ncbi:LacI family transcriptional regulator, partial [bacterium]|nr:LacI family transcriptional regulator [bacterium]